MSPTPPLLEAANDWLMQQREVDRLIMVPYVLAFIGEAFNEQGMKAQLLEREFFVSGGRCNPFNGSLSSVTLRADAVLLQVEDRFHGLLGVKDWESAQAQEIRSMILKGSIDQVYEAGWVHEAPVLNGVDPSIKLQFLKPEHRAELDALLLAGTAQVAVSSSPRRRV